MPTNCFTVLLAWSSISRISSLENWGGATARDAEVSSKLSLEAVGACFANHRGRYVHPPNIVN